MFGFTPSLKQNALAATLVGRKQVHCFGYWVESNSTSIEQDPMQLASFNRGSGK